MIERAREALGSRPPEPAAEDESGAASEQPEHEPVRGSRPPSELRRSVAEAGQRIQEIVDAAELVAAEIEADARAEAERYLSDQMREADRLFEARADKLQDQSAGVLDRADALRDEAAALTSEMGRIVDCLRGSSEEAGPRVADTATAERPTSVADPPVSSSPAAVAEAPPGRVSEEALLRATQMAVAGNSREEIKTALGGEFGVADPSSVVDEILGPE